MNVIASPSFARKAAHAAGVVLASLALTGAAVAQDTPAAGAASVKASAPATARVRAFGQNGITIDFYQNSACVRGKAEKTAAAGGLGSAFSSLFGKASNTTIGMTETPNTKNLSQRDRMGSKAYYREYEVAAGQPMSVAMYFQSPGMNVACSRVGTTFVPEAGKQYETMLDVGNGKCMAVVQEIATDDQGQVAMKEAVTTPTSECN